MLSTEKYEFDPSYRGQTGSSIGVSTVGFRSNKYNTNEWHENNYAKYHQTFSDRDASEKQRWQATRTENETLALSQQTQALSTKKLQQRLHDINFWKFELNRMIEDVRNETDLLIAQKKRLTNSLDGTEAPLHIATECLANRDRRYGEDRVVDGVEVGLLKEVEIINNVQNLLRQTIMTAEQQISFNTTAFQSMRGFFQVKLLDEMKNTFTPFYAILRDLQVNNVRRPGDFETAVKDKEAAKENIKIAENERPKLLTQARTEYQKALKQAQIINERAETDSNIILNQADAEAQAVRTRYSTETETFAKLKNKMGLTVESLLNYMAIRVIGSSKNDVYINMKSPAQVKYEL
ncbi:unnamed protein product [Rotaria socialis]